MIRIVLLLVLFILIARMFWRVIDNVIEAAGGRPPGATRHPQRGVSMARDPVCGTFVLPERALSVEAARGRVYFCSDACREKYRTRSAGGRRAEGRTA